MNPVSTRAISRSVRGLNREITIDCTTNPSHPSRGGTQGYPIWQRNIAMNNFYRLHDYGCAA